MNWSSIATEVTQILLSSGWLNTSTDHRENRLGFNLERFNADTQEDEGSAVLSTLSDTDLHRSCSRPDTSVSWIRFRTPD